MRVNGKYDWIEIYGTSSFALSAIYEWNVFAGKGVVWDCEKRFLVRRDAHPLFYNLSYLYGNSY